MIMHPITYGKIYHELRFKKYDLGVHRRRAIKKESPRLFRQFATKRAANLRLKVATQRYGDHFYLFSFIPLNI